ncbi:hypothetical protein BT96DRAFT_667367 [Gymnopus androsaceus JB14]|uniref:Uncharacterized protein n=1 Tax=Gymnopus androsaceus JB14 TaxID=1447944 RepID=A0A6A4IDL7_9AGAR|nr:hypothetical protein BT96DRAFT_667367 [Gymnopus androsaceus JB14]
METRQIRVLHLVSPSQVYVISRSPAPMPIYPITGASPEIATRFATVSLKTCVEIIYDSCSEIFSSNLDHSVHTLDPLEAHGAASSSSSTHGVPVACGRLSAIRSSNNRTMVTGTLMKDRAGQNALEVVFVLYETPTLTQVLDLAAADRIGAAVARRTSEHQGRAQRQQKEKQRGQEGQRTRAKPKFIPRTEADRLLEESGQAGQSYRPYKRETTEVDPVLGQCKTVTGDPREEPKPKTFAFRPYPTQGASQKSTSNVPPNQSSHSSSTLPASQPSSELLSILDVLKSDPRVNSNALFSVMSFIDSATKKDSTLTIAEILRQLIPPTSAVSPQRPQTPPQTPVASNTPSSPDDGIVVLDKENVNPSVFQRRAERDTEDAKLLASSMRAPGNSTSDLTPRLGAGLSKSIRSNTTLNNDPTPPAPSTPTARKRTLSEVSEDGRSRRDQGRFMERWSSPPRSSRTNENMSPGSLKINLSSYRTHRPLRDQVVYLELGLNHTCSLIGLGQQQLCSRDCQSKRRRR